MIPSPTGSLPDADRRPNGIIIAIGLSLVVAVIVIAFAWPGVVADPKNLPVAIVGPDEQIAQIVPMIESNSDGALKLTPEPDRDAAMKGIQERKYYGAIVFGQSPEMLVANAANPMVAQMLTAFATQFQELQGDPAGAITVTDVVPLLDDDPRGSGMTSAALPLVLGGMLGGVAIALSVHGIRNWVTSLLVYVAAAGMAIVLVMQSWFGVLAGSWWLNVLVFASCLLAIAATIVGSIARLGDVGIAVGPVVFLLFANPIAGVTVPREFLPSPWGDVGQWFPPGAGAALLRSVSYFPDASTVFPWLVLTGWIVLGFVLMLAGTNRKSLMN